MLRWLSKINKKGNKHTSANVILSDKGYYNLKVPGIRINDHFQVVNEKGEANNRIYMMAVPYIGGFNPDYSGLDFVEAVSVEIIEKIFSPDY